MAAAWRSQCLFSRFFNVKSIKTLNNSTYFDKTLTSGPFSVCLKYYSNYAKSPFVEKIKEQYEFETIKDPKTWEYVERLLPFESIPKVTPKEVYPSGWKPPKEDAKSLVYFIPRMKNHELPIHLVLKYRGAQKITKIKGIEGDIWLMNDVLKSYLAEKNNRYVETRVHELVRSIEVKGDHVSLVTQWAHSKGF